MSFCIRRILLIEYIFINIVELTRRENFRGYWSYLQMNLDTLRDIYNI